MVSIGPEDGGLSCGAAARRDGHAGLYEQVMRTCGIAVDAASASWCLAHPPAPSRRRCRALEKEAVNTGRAGTVSVPARR